MARHPRTTRQIPVPASSGAEMILCAPFPASRGGDGWAGAMYAAVAGGTTTVFQVTATPLWTAFEAAAEAVADRFNGSRLKVNGQVVVVTDYDGTDQFTVEPALSAALAAGDLVKVEADIPLYVTEVMLIANAAALHFNTMQLNLIANGVRNTIQAGSAHMLIDSDHGTPGFNINMLAAADVATTVELRVSV